MSFHWSEDTSKAKSETLCGKTVLTAFCAHSYIAVTCEDCRKRVHSLTVTCPVIIKKSGEAIRGCGETYVLEKTRVTKSFLRLCPKCDPQTLPVVLDSRGNRVYLPPKWHLGGMRGENDEQVKGIRLKGNQ